MNNIAKAWATVAAVLAVIFVAALIQHAAAMSDYRGELRESEARARLYVSAEGHDISIPGVERKLGQDIYAYVKDHGNLDGFRGDSNAYGGIADAIGEDPFNGVSCAECGPLKTNWQTNLETAAKGQANVPDLIDAPEKPTSWHRYLGYTLLIWLLALPVLLGLSRLLDRQRSLRITRTYSIEDHRLLNALDRQLEQGRADPELLQLRDGLRRALNERATAGDDARTAMLIDRLKEDARDRLDALEAGNRYFEKGE